MQQMTHFLSKASQCLCPTTSHTFNWDDFWLVLRSGEDVEVHYLKTPSRFLIQKELLINKSAPSPQHFSEWQKEAELHPAAAFPACCCHCIVHSLRSACSSSSWPTATSTHFTSPCERQQAQRSGQTGNISITIVLVFHSRIFLSCKMEASIKYSSISPILVLSPSEQRESKVMGGKKKRCFHILPEH